MKRVLSVAVVLVAALVLFAPTSHAKIYVGASITQTSVDTDIKIVFDLENGRDFVLHQGGAQIKGLRQPEE